MPMPCAYGRIVIERASILATKYARLQEKETGLLTSRGLNSATSRERGSSKLQPSTIAIADIF